MSGSRFLGKDQVEAIVFGDLKKRYPKMEKFEFARVILYETFKEWWVMGLFSFEGKVRGFIYRLNGETGEIKSYEIVF